MKRIITAFCLLILGVSIHALKISNPQGKEIELSYQRLNEEKLTEFKTERNKNGKNITETWLGIPLIPWLKSLGIADWHSMRCISYDAYEVVMHRIELDNMPAFIAMYHEGEAISEQDLRVIFPTTRESKWLRGVAQIQLKPYQASPHPRYIYSWEDAYPRFASIDNELSIDKLMANAFSQSDGTMIIVDSNFNPVALDYPAHLAEKAIMVNSDGSVLLNDIKSIGVTPLKDIIYMQSGPFAYIKMQYLPQMFKLGSSLGWDWAEIDLSVIQALTKTPIQSNETPKLRSGGFLELW